MVIGVVANDAGGAEVVSSFVRRKFSDYRWFATGPAESIFGRKLSGSSAESLVALFEGIDRLVCGTSGRAMLEWEAIRLARARRVHSAAMLDHWTNYRARFLRGGRVQFPDEVWIGDDHAERRAQLELPGARLRRVENVYLEEAVDQVLALAAADVPYRQGLCALYVTEPLDSGPLDGGGPALLQETSREALKFFLDNLDRVSTSPGIEEVVVRPHPSEPSDKYLWAEDVDPRVRVDRDRTLEEQITSADLVVGVSSMALVISLLAGKRTMTAIPPAFGEISLPFPEIEHLRELLGSGGAVSC
jgi:hypothetical protein